MALGLCIYFAALVFAAAWPVYGLWAGTLIILSYVTFSHWYVLNHNMAVVNGDDLDSYLHGEACKIDGRGHVYDFCCMNCGAPGSERATRWFADNYASGRVFYESTISVVGCSAACPLWRDHACSLFKPPRPLLLEAPGEAPEWCPLRDRALMIERSELEPPRACVIALDE